MTISNTGTPKACGAARRYRRMVPATPAGLRARVRAFAWDYLVILGYLGVLALMGTFLTLGPVAERWSALLSTPWRRDLLAFLTAVLPVTLYFGLSEGSPAGATWGKRRTGIRVVGHDGVSLGRPRSR